jgi:hypothetical protein
MPSNAIRLNQSEIEHVKSWINNGCPDLNGTIPVKPNLQPNIIGYAAYDLANNRLDTVRLDNFPVNPFLVNANDTIRIGYLITDTADGADATPNSMMTVKEIRFSTDKNNFTNAIPNPSIYYLPIDGFINQFTINWPPGTTVYFRIYVNDGDHGSVNSEFPRNQSLDYYKTYYSFYVQ